MEDIVIETDSIVIWPHTGTVLLALLSYKFYILITFVTSIEYIKICTKSNFINKHINVNQEIKSSHDLSL